MKRGIWITSRGVLYISKMPDIHLINAANSLLRKANAFINEIDSLRTGEYVNTELPIQILIGPLETAFPTFIDLRKEIQKRDLWRLNGVNQFAVPGKV